MNKILNILLFTSFYFLISFSHATDDINIIAKDESLFITVSKTDDEAFQIIVGLPNGDEVVSKLFFDDNKTNYEGIQHSCISIQEEENQAIILSFDDHSGDVFSCEINSEGNLSINKVNLIEDLKITTFGSISIPPQEIIARNLYVQAKEVHNKAQFWGNSCAIIFLNKFYNYATGEIGHINKTEQLIIQSTQQTASSIVNKGKITAIHGFTLQATNLLNATTGSIITKDFLQIAMTNEIVNKGLLHSDGRQTISGVTLINKNKIETLSDISIKVDNLINKNLINTALGGSIEASQKLHNFKGAIISSHDLCCISNGSIFNEKGKIDVRSNLSINVSPGQFINLGGEIFANDNLNILAYYFVNSRTDPKLIPAEPVKGNYEHTVRGAYQIETSPPALLISKNGNVSLEFNTGKNEASLIHSGKKTLIKVAHYFDNKAHYLRNDTKRRTEERRTEKVLGVFQESYWVWGL